MLAWKCFCLYIGTIGQGGGSGCTSRSTNCGDDTRRNTSRRKVVSVRFRRRCTCTERESVNFDGGSIWLIACIAAQPQLATAPEPNKLYLIIETKHLIIEAKYPINTASYLFILVLDLRAAPACPGVACGPTANGNFLHFATFSAFCTFSAPGF